MRVLITGATRGIGRACAEAFAAAGYAVTAVARSESDLAAMVPQWRRRGWPPLTVEAVDLSRDLPAPGAYDILLLNAGTYRPGGLLDPERDIFTDLWPLNVGANHRLGRHYLPGMVARGSGHLIVIGSTATDDNPTEMTAYAATKQALRGLFAGWKRELVGTGVRATLIAPGATLTSSWDGQSLPRAILDPARIAEVALTAIKTGREGRIVVRAE